MARSSTRVHFRNVVQPNRNWHCASRSKKIRQCRFRWAFCLFESNARGSCEGQLQMFEREIPARKIRFGAACTVIVACLSLAAAGFSQDAGASSTAKKPATAKKKTTSSSSHHSSSSTTKTSGKTHSATGKRSSRKRSARVRGQQKIDGERAQAIQEALIRQHYLSGEASGTWNQASEEAMRRYQADHGWQSKTVPDSRALISLGLGPSKDHLLNPDSAMTTVPDAPKSQPIPTSSYSAPATASPVTPAGQTSTPVPASTPAAATSSPQ